MDFSRVDDEWQCVNRACALKRHVCHCAQVTPGAGTEKPFPFLSSSCVPRVGARARAESSAGSNRCREESLLLVTLQQLLVEEQVCLRVEYPWLWYRLNGGVTDVHPLALGAAADVPRTWNTHGLLISRHTEEMLLTELSENLQKTWQTFVKCFL